MNKRSKRWFQKKIFLLTINKTKSFLKGNMQEDNKNSLKKIKNRFCSENQIWDSKEFKNTHN